MSDYGALSTGFKRKRLDVIIEELCAYMKNNLGVDPSENPQSILSVLNTSMADQLEQIWEALELCYLALYPFSAEGTNLDNVLQIAGFLRKSKARSKYTLACTGDDGTLIPYGSIVKSTTQPSRQLQASINQYITRENFWQIKIRPVSTGINKDTTYTLTLHQNVASGAVGTVVETYTKTITGCADLAQAYSAMLSAMLECGNKIGLTVTEEDTGQINADGETIKCIVLTGNNRTDSFFAVLTTNVQVDAVTSNLIYETVDYGDISLPNGTITEIVTNVVGLTAVNNAIPYTPGRLAETDSEVRADYTKRLAIRGSGTINSICSTLLSDVNDVDYAVGYENPRDEEDSEGRPPHSIEIVVHGGNDADVASAIWHGKTGGIRSYGHQYAYVTDDYGVQQYVQFSRILSVYLLLKIELVVNASELDNNYMEKIESILTNMEFEPGTSVQLQKLVPDILSAVNGIDYVGMYGQLSDTEDVTSAGSAWKKGTIPVGLRQQPIVTASCLQITVEGE